MAVHALKARFVFPVSARPIAHGMVGFENGRITGVGKRIAADTVEDLGNVAILPGLVNAHTHLEFSDLQKPLGQPGIGFVDWIRRVIEYRVGRGASNSAAIEKGLSECARCGVTAIGEIAQMDCTTTTEHAPAADGISFLEIIAPTPDRAADAVEFLENDFNKSQILNNPSPRAATRGLNGVNNPAHNSTSNPSEFDWRLGLSPHAPYSVHPKLLEKIIELSVRHQVPLAMHLAESREEIEYLAQGAGPLKDLLIELGAYDPSTVAPGSRPLDYLQMLAVAHRVMIVHGNFLTHDEIGLLADHAETMSVVYCPRTHAFFRRDRYPLEQMLTAGVTVCLGTDSRASSPDLDLLAEIRLVARQYPDIPLPMVLQLGTLQGAMALGREKKIGTLEPGKYANLAVVPLPVDEPADPWKLLFDSDNPVSATWFRGKRVS